MLTVTEAALTHLSAMRDAVPDEIEEKVAFRITRTPEGVGLVVDSPRSGDEIHEHDGKPLLVVDEPTSEAIADLTLDVQEEEGKETLTLR